jgi:hypothetical protein
MRISTLNSLTHYLVALCVLTLGGTAPLFAADASTRSHDFDFNRGYWKSHIIRTPDPFGAPSHTVELNGTVAVRPVWDGRGWLEEIEAEGPGGHWQGLTLFLFNPQSKEWSQSFIGSQEATPPSPLVGTFKNGRGELLSSDTFKDRGILVRGVWSDIKADSHRYEESYSDDGGASWHTAFSATLTRLNQAPEVAAQSEVGRSHEFDFDFGPWKTHSSRLLHPLTGSQEWTELEGTTEVEQVWGGRANLAVFKATGPSGPLELLALRWYNAAAHQWYLDFATPNVGVLGIPGVGDFKNGRGVFYDAESINGKTVLVRFSIWGISPNSAQSEQAFSADGGRTWEVNWINRYTRG